VKAARPDLDGSTRALLVRVQRLEARLESGSADASDPPIPGPQSPETQSPETQSPETRRPDPISEPVLTRAVPSIVASSRATAAAAPEPDRQEATVPPVAQVAPIAQPPIAQPAPVGGELDTLVSLWPAVLDTVRAENALLGALITEARLESLSDDDLTLAFAASAAFLKRKAEGPANRAILTEALRQITGRRLRLSYELREENSSESEPDGAVPTEEEFLARLMAEFDAEELSEDWLPEQKGQ
jgi:hypothetical protein